MRIASSTDFRKFAPKDFRISLVDERFFAAAEQYRNTLRLKCLDFVVTLIVRS